MNSWSAYLGGVMALFVTVGAVAVAGHRLRRWAAPDLGGALGALVTAVIAVALLVGISLGLGAVGQLRAPALLGAALLLAGSTLAVRGPAARPAPAGPPIGRVDLVLVSAAVVAVSAQWLAFTVGSYRTGILSDDSLSYHLPWAARFAASGEVLPLHWFVPGLTTNLDPASGQLLHAVPMVALGTDVVSPALNLGWLALALLAGWCLGQRWGTAPGCTAAVAAIAAVPLMARSQAGQALTDLAALTLLLAAIALLAHAAGRTRLIFIAGIAGGLGLSVKLSVAVALAALTVVLGIGAEPGRRSRTLGAWLLGVAVLGGPWFVRNWIAVGSPLPQLPLPGFPDLGFPLNEETGYSLAHYLGDGDLWRDTFVPGFRSALGAAWLPLMAAALTGALLAVGQRASSMLRGVGLVALAAAAGYVVTPGTAFGPEGQPVLFMQNLRIAIPALLFGMLALPLAVRCRWSDPRRDRVVLTVFAALSALAHLSRGGYPAWPTSGRLVAAAIVAAGLAGWALIRSARPLSGQRRWPIVVVSGCGLVGLVLAGRAGEERYLEDRYREGGTMRQSAYEWARGQRDARIAVAGFYQTYPLAGLDLSNHVQWVGVHPRPGEFESAPDCRTWRKALAEGGYDFVVTAPYADQGVPTPSEDGWTRTDPGATVVVEDRALTVFELAAPPDPDSCS